ncbi:exocyst complex component 8-like [Limulus polyphemus]|uniref:Exocyst complex component 8-like n=1 Tax=Limulus polyphemus TaxID=6850 RepID=A0ABM1T6G4_LIMPO|nr:exocyst complex component 8-like [Limulus polyphemus]
MDYENEFLIKKLNEQNFNSNSYVQELTLNSLGVDGLLVKRQLVQSLAEETNGLLKKNVYKNYTQFIETAKEISYLESEMYQLSHMLTEQQTILSTLMDISITGEKVGSKSEVQSDKKEEESRKNLSSLLEKVEGCALHICVLKYFCFFRRGPAQYRFQVFYELDNLAIVNVKEDPMLKNVFKILMFPDTRLFQCDTAAAKVRIQSFEDEESEEGYQVEREEVIPDWLVELPENLDVCIAQRDFEEAVNLVKKGNEHFLELTKHAVVKEIRTRIERRIKNLVDVLMNELRVSPDRSLQGGPRAARRAVGLLIKLGKSSQACNLFLKHRSAILKHSMKQKKMEGATVPFIKRLSSVFFNNMMETGREFNRAFSNSNSCASAYVVWSRKQLQQFVQTFSRHVFTTQVSLRTAAECVALVKGHCDQLVEIGLDILFDLSNLLQADVERVITESRDKMLEAIKLRAAEDKWRPQNHQNKAGISKFVEDMTEIGIASIHRYIYDECWVALTSNTTVFSKSYLNFLDDLLKLHTLTSNKLIVDSLVVTFRAQLRHVEASLNSEIFKSDVKFIQKNANFLLETLLTLAEHRFEEKLGFGSPQLSELHIELPRLISGTSESSASGKSSVTKYSSVAYL